MSSVIAVLINPSAGKGRGRRIGEAVIVHLQGRGAQVRAYRGSSAAETAQLAAEALQTGPTGLVVVGGDGTLSGILPVLGREHPPVTLVPAGTGNDFARAVGIPPNDPMAAADLALDGVTRRIDVGEIDCRGEVRPFLTVVALGFDARVSERTNQLRWPRGILRYYLALIIEVVRLRATPFRLGCDDEPVTDAAGTLIAVGNTDSYGGGMPICRGAASDDGLLDLVHVGPLGRLRLIALFPRLLRGTHLGLRQVAHRRVTRVSVSAPGLRVYADGERVAEEECVIGIRPRALAIRVPGGASGD